MVNSLFTVSFAIERPKSGRGRKPNHSNVKTNGKDQFLIIIIKTALFDSVNPKKGQLYAMVNSLFTVTFALEGPKRGRGRKPNHSNVKTNGKDQFLSVVIVGDLVKLKR